MICAHGFVGSLLILEPETINNEHYLTDLAH